MKITFTFLLSLISLMTTLAQTTPKPEAPIEKDNSIKGQFEYLYKKSNNYQEFKVVKRTSIIALKTNTLDTLKQIEQKLVAANLKIDNLRNKVEKTNNLLEQTNQNLSNTQEEVDSFSFLGTNMTKSAFKTVVIAIFFSLLGLLGFFIYKFNKSNAVTKNAISSLDEVEKEFEDHRRKSLEREQKVMRKLQDEINKHK